MMRHRLIILAFSLSAMRCLPASNGSNHVYRTYSRLAQDILDRPVSRYRIPPCLDSGYQERYQLQLSNVFVNIHAFDEIKQVMTIQLYYGVTWYHHELTWDPSAYDNITTISLDSANVWTPRMEVNMGAEGYSTLDFSGDLEINSRGGVTFLKLGFLSFACSIDFKCYPFDIQVCTFGFYPHGPPHAEPAFFASNFTLSKIYNDSGEWTLQKIEHTIVDLMYDGVMVLIPTYRLVVRRNSMYYVVCIVFPLVLTSAMIPLVFVIPSQTGEKVSYLIALFTSTAVFLNYISDVMPRSLLQMPYLARLLVEVLVEGLLALLAALLVVNVHVKEELGKLKNKELHLDNTYGALIQDSGTSKQASVATRKSAFCDVTKTVMSDRLDRAFFLVFFIGQITFLVTLFLCSDWVGATK